MPPGSVGTGGAPTRSGPRSSRSAPLSRTRPPGRTGSGGGGGRRREGGGGGAGGGGGGGGGGPPVRRIVAFARSQGIPVKVLDRRALGHLAGTTAHQGIVAQVAEVRYVGLEDLLGVARQRRGGPLLPPPRGGPE